MALDVLKQLHEKGITAEQLASAKNYLKGQYPTRLETSDQLANQLADLEFYGLDAHDVDDYYPKLDAMTLADAQRIIKTYYPLDNLVFVVIGKASEIGPGGEEIRAANGYTLNFRSGFLAGRRRALIERATPEMLSARLCFPARL